MSEYQLKKLKSCLLPETVYRQAVWAVKDLPRMREKLRILESSLDSMPLTETGQPRSSGNGYADLTAMRASQIVNLTTRIHTIEECLKYVPEKYRDGILSKLAYGVPYPDSYHINTWKKWQQTYLYQVALGLQLY